jgi:hypothetical protein
MTVRRPRLCAGLVGMAALALVACGGPAASTTPSPATAGVDLLTMAGPTCPVQREGQTCVKPVSVLVQVLTSPGGKAVTTVQTGVDGKAHVPLPPGTYLVRGEAGKGGLPRPPVGSTVTVQAGVFTPLTLNYDTGIR